ncbi:amino acid permease [Pantoea vagans]|uniref:amino acid permease n=1 Tax=Pantoea vagans TaxID=470934 RepID=UPI00366F312B
MSSVCETSSQTGLRRVLKSRHMSMIAIGGSVGTGLFIASGATISQAGPAGALLSYLLIGVMVYFVMTSLAELATAMPESGSFALYGARYVDEGFGFALGWNFWFSWAVAVAVDLVAAQLVMGYWLPDVPGWVWSATFLVIIFLLNAISVRGFGEAEYWFSLIKVTTVLLFIITGLMMIAGILRGAPSSGFDNWFTGGGPFSGGFTALIGTAMIAGVSFQGTELVGIAAGESDNPVKAIPRAVRQVFWRILLFYVFAILVISLIVPSDDPRLLRNDIADISVSPFALVFRNAGLLSAAAVMNAVILTSVVSAGNSGVYSSTRMLFNLAREGNAPRIFSRLTQHGVPLYALVATTMVAALCLLTSLFGNHEVYMWLLNMTGMTGFICWAGIAVSHYRFRRGFVRQGHKFSRLPYRAAWFPVGPALAFGMCVVVMLGQNYMAFIQQSVDWYNVAATYVGILLFLLTWLGYRITKKSRFVSYDEMIFPEEVTGDKQV